MTPWFLKTFILTTFQPFSISPFENIMPEATT